METVTWGTCFVSGEWSALSLPLSPSASWCPVSGCFPLPHPSAVTLCLIPGPEERGWPSMA